MEAWAKIISKACAPWTFKVCCSYSGVIQVQPNPSGSISELDDIIGIIMSDAGLDYDLVSPMVNQAYTASDISGGVAVAMAKSAGSDYRPPAGGGGVTSTIKANGKTIDFGHGGHHLEGTGLDINTVNQKLANEVSKIHPGTGQFYKGRININGVTIEYTSYGVGNGVINIGTYYPVP